MALATWQGPFDALLPDLSILRVGETYEVGETELKSAHWKRVRPAKPGAADNPIVVATDSAKAAD